MKSEIVLQRLVELSRREFLSRGLTVAGWGAFATVLGAGAIETVRFFFPRVLFTPPSRFRVGAPEVFVSRGGEPDAYGVILVDERWKPEHRFFIVRERDRVYALSARCVHLGCTINWFRNVGIFKCPCHGSEYRSNGKHFAGPAPRPLDRFRIVLNVAGELVVDTSIVYGPERFHVDGAFVQL
jgi:cytochrome b6-f complex iron-sulfur subunit